MTLLSLLPRVEPNERGRFYPAALGFMCVASAALMARALGDSLFLSRLGSHGLPFMYVVGALVTGAGSYACARAAPRVSTSRIGVFVAVVLIVVNVIVYLTLDALPNASRVTAYLLADVTGRILVILYWALVTEVFDARESRRLFGLIGAMGTTACLPTGFLVGPLARRLGLPSLIFIVCGLLTGFVIAVRLLQQREKSERAAAGGRRELIATNRQSAGQLHRKSQFVTIAALAAATSLVQTLVDYQFKASFSSRLGGAALAATFGQLYAHASLAALFLQLFLVHRILSWGGVLVSLSVLPIAIMGASAAILKTASSAWVYATKAMDVTLTLTVNGTARQMLYRGIRSESRMQARALAEGLYQPIAVAAAGSLLALNVNSLNVRTMAGVTIAGCVIWAFLARSAYASYVSGLISSLRAARFESDDEAFAAHEPAVRKYVLNALTSAPGEQVKYLAAVLPKVLLQANHEDPEVRWTIVRAAAAGEFPAHESLLRAKLNDPHPRVRAFAAACLVNGGTQAAGAGRAMLEMLAFSASAADRQAAAEGIAELRRGGFAPLVSRLLRSDEEEVLEAALDACLTQPDATLIPAVLPLLTRRRLAADASDALVAIGGIAVAPVVSFLRKTPRPQRTEVMKKLARAIARNRRVEALPLVGRMARRVGTEDRAAVLQAYGDLMRSRSSPEEDFSALDAMIAREAQEGMAHVGVLRELPAAPATELLRVALVHLVRCHARNAFLLLDVRIKEVYMMSLYSTLSSGSRESRSQVMELLHNLIPEDLQSPLLDVLAEAEVQALDGAADPRAAISRVLEMPASDWVTVGALHAASHLPVRARRREMRRLLEHYDPVVRETALAALARIERRSTLVRQCIPLTDDADETVRQFAVSLSRPE